MPVAQKEKMEEFGTLKVVGENSSELPMWAIINYLDTTCNNYAKIEIINYLCKIAQEGEMLDDVYVTRQPFPIEPDKRYFSNSINYKFTNIFWKYLITNPRPMIFQGMEVGKRKSRGDVITHHKTFSHIVPSFSYSSKTSIRIVTFSCNSPISIELKGVVSSLIELACAGSRHDMETSEHISRQANNLIEGYEKMARAYQVINDPKTPEGIKAYANQGLMQIREIQERLNKQLGIRYDSIDIDI